MNILARLHQGALEDGSWQLGASHGVGFRVLGFRVLGFRV